MLKGICSLNYDLVLVMHRVMRDYDQQHTIMNKHACRGQSNGRCSWSYGKDSGIIKGSGGKRRFATGEPSNNRESIAFIRLAHRERWYSLKIHHSQLVVFRPEFIIG